MLFILLCMFFSFIYSSLFVNSLPIGVVCKLLTFANSLDPDQA